MQNQPGGYSVLSMCAGILQWFLTYSTGTIREHEDLRPAYIGVLSDYIYRVHASIVVATHRRARHAHPRRCAPPRCLGSVLVSGAGRPARRRAFGRATEHPGLYELLRAVRRALVLRAACCVLRAGQTYPRALVQWHMAFRRAACLAIVLFAALVDGGKVVRVRETVVVSNFTALARLLTALALLMAARG